jgi:2-alkenal reductase
MVDRTNNRLRHVALTGVLAPGLLLGAAGMMGPADALAQATSTNGVCTSFGAPSAASSDMSAADVAAKVEPAVVTVVNLQQMNSADMSGFPDINGFPDMPAAPGSEQLPSGQGSDGSQGSKPDENSPQGAADNDQGQPDANAPQSGDAEQQSASDGSDANVPAGVGSGFIVDQDGHVITNAHVVEGAQDLTVTLSDGTDVPATVVGKDDLLDIAVLELDLPAGTTIPGVVSFGDSSKLRPGDSVVAIGTALGSYPNTVSEGTVNGMHRSLGGEYPLSAMIQNDAEIWHGDSGGPLLNLQGEVVGINTAGIGSGMMGSDTGAASMGFALESNVACNAAAELLANGHIVWPYLGIQAESTPQGESVADVVADGPSDKAGLQQGEVITEVDGQKVDRQHTLLDLLYGHKPGDMVDLTVDRNGTTSTMQVTLGERPAVTQ